MGTIKAKFSPLAPEKTAKQLFECWGDAMIENGCTEDQAKQICHKVALMTYDAMNREYTVMGGYSAEEQLFYKAEMLLGELDEAGKLDEMLAELKASKPATEAANEVAEPDLEDAYNIADSIEFAGSEKQIKWARDIALNNLHGIAMSGASIKDMPDSARWWIENRSDIYSGLKAVKR